jgi:putative protease
MRAGDAQASLRSTVGSRAPLRRRRRPSSSSFRRGVETPPPVRAASTNDGANAGTSGGAKDGARKGARYLEQARVAGGSTSGRYDDGTDGHSRRQRTSLAGARKPEVLAPAGGWPQLRAAIAAGADCVYLGLDALNARARASNFTVEELPEVTAYAKSRGARVYVTMNVLVFDEELKLAEKLIRGVAEAGVDAVIVQDVGVARLIKRVAPNLPIHGSTQMSVTSAEGARFARELGCKRVVVGRELSLRDIHAVKAECPDVEVEAFVHGALCVSYSGQCFSSEAWGGRSANRGQCAQACRMPYGLVVDGDLAELGDVKYLLSPQDLMAVDLVPELIESGVGCFKIEGRLKGPEYVAIATQAYRKAVDAAWEAMETGREVQRSELLSKEQRLELAQVFARGQDADYDGLTHGFLDGPRHQGLVRGRAPRHRGVLLGEIMRVVKPDGGKRANGAVMIRMSDGAGMKRGDGVVIDRGVPEEKEEGGRVYEIFDRAGALVGGKGEAVSTGEYTVTFGANQIDFNRVEVGQLVWRTSDPTLEAKLAKMVPTESTDVTSRDGRRDPATVVVSGALGEPLTVKIIDDAGRVGQGRTASVLEKSQKKALDEKSLKKAIGELGGTPLVVAKVDTTTLRGIVEDGATVESGAGLYIPPGDIKSARRDAVEALLNARRDGGPDRAAGMAEVDVVDELVGNAWWGDIMNQKDKPTRGATTSSSSSSSKGSKPSISVLCRTRAQAEAAIQVNGVEEIALDFLEVHGLQKTVQLVQGAGKIAVVATPRVLKPEEEQLWRYYLNLNADALLIRSAGLLQTLLELKKANADVKIPPLRGDFSLNAANAIGADVFLKSGLERLTPTHDLNAEQQRALAVALGPVGASKLELIAHQHLPIFHTEHCVFCRFLSDGNSFKDCGHPCESKHIHLRDNHGADHLVLADMGCRNTVFNAQAQTGVSYLKTWISAGISHFRVELVDEPASVVPDLLRAYQSVLTGRKSPGEVASWLSSLPDANGRAHGVSRGSLEVKTELARGDLRPTAAASREASRKRRSGGAKSKTRASSS